MTGAYTAQPNNETSSDPPYLTFRHWSGVTPYTSSYEFAGSCVFAKQSPGNLSLRPTDTKKVCGQALSRSYGRFFAEFLKDLSLVRLGLLDLTTCVGLGTVPYAYNLRSFSWKRAPQIYKRERSHSDSTWACATRLYLGGTLIAPAPIQ